MFNWTNEEKSLPYSKSVDFVLHVGILLLTMVKMCTLLWMKIYSPDEKKTTHDSISALSTLQAGILYCLAGATTVNIA